MAMKMLMFFVILLLFVNTIANAQTCESQYLCRNGTNDGGKSFFAYFAGEPTENSILNITHNFLNTTAVNQKACVKKCMLNATCFGANAGPVETMFDGMQVHEFVECHLYKENIYSNKSLIAKKTGWIHVSLKNTGCDERLCKNNGTCLPGYNNDSFTCECPMSHWGDFCEERRPFAFGGTTTGLTIDYCHYPFSYGGKEYKDCTFDAPPSLTAVRAWCGTTADSSVFGFCSFEALPTWKFTFDDITNIQNIGTDAVAQATITAYSKIVSVPERPGNVLQVSGGAALSVLSATTKMQECYLNPDACSELTLALWAKLLLKDLEVQTAANSTAQRTTVLHQPDVGPTLWFDYQTRNWTIEYQTVTKHVLASHGPYNPLEWRHFGVQFDGTTLNFYIDSIHVASGASVSQSGSGDVTGVILFSHNGLDYCVPGYYMIDDFVYFYEKMQPIAAVYLSDSVKEKTSKEVKDKYAPVEIVEVSPPKPDQKHN
ncbi:uncharacterized protein LOC130625669 [Hydractinia symbiolongicarpus]|uniref:uncharacterized protein LOC130625669 n=1 Tax=Hydractinia symbiolongicarpus TaxID=13093 RepID=UPI00254F4400|nr:uncharacterized protein LOC130625669 [Hydractinia symbiolongicarpus]